MWTMSHGALIGPDATVVQVDVESEALGRNRPITFGVVGDVAATATTCATALDRRTDDGYRSRDVRPAHRRRDPLTATSRRRTAPRPSASTARSAPPSTTCCRRNGSWPPTPATSRVTRAPTSPFPDEYGFCMTQAYQSIGLGLATTIGAALARPDRLPVAALGDGGALMGVSELDTVVRLGLPMVVVVYDDGYGAEVRHFGPDGHDLGTVIFPDTDIATIARGFGFEAAASPFHP